MPIVNGKYKNPGWVNNQPPRINATEMNAISDTLETLDAGGGTGSGVTSFNGRTGAVTPQAGDYTAAQVGAVPTTRKVNGKPLISDITLTASDVSAVPTTRTVNGKALSSNISLTASDVNAAPIQSPVFKNSITLGTRATGDPVGDFSVSLGSSNVASGPYSVAIGTGCFADSTGAYSEGLQTTSNSNAAHAEGQSTAAHGTCSHAEGFQTTAQGEAAHAEGYQTQADGAYSHSAGKGTRATVAGQYAIGAYNELKAAPTKFIVGSGSSDTSRSNCFRVTDTGTYGVGAWNSSGADYAEMFEWLDGNPEAEDRCGMFVTLEGDKIRIASPEDNFILGIVSGNPSVVGDVHDDQWQGMYLYDIFGRPLYEDMEVSAQTVELPDPDNPGETIPELIIPAHTERRQKLNPGYDSTKKYRPRTERPEWDAVGITGKLVVVDDGTCQVNGWAEVGDGGRATKSIERTKYRVMARLDNYHIRVIIL